MTENTGNSIINACQYLRKVCDEITQISKILEQRFSNFLPDGIAIHTVDHKPSQKPGSEFFEACSCQFSIKEKKAKTPNIGYATYFFDLGRTGRLAAIKSTPLVIVTWADANEGAYELGAIEVIRQSHKPLGGRLMRYINPESKKPTDEAWLYLVPLMTIETEADIDRLLVKPLVHLATASPLTSIIVDQAFNQAPEVLTEQPNEYLAGGE
jgi:hypothetical protein